MPRIYGKLHKVMQGIEFIAVTFSFRAGDESAHHGSEPGEAACFHFEPYAISCAS